MKNQRDKLHQYQRRITVLTSLETEIAKEMLAKGDKPRALLALRRKKYQESLLSKTDAQLEQLEQLTSSVEFALVQKDVVFGLQQGTIVLQEIHKEMGGIEHVEKLMGETADAVAYQQVSTLLRNFRIDLPFYGGKLIVFLNRKSVRCWAGKYLIRTKMKSRRSLRHLRQSSRASYPRYPLRNFRQKPEWKRERSGRKKQDR
jgi:charged multivesicular body protein 6